MIEILEEITFIKNFLDIISRLSEFHSKLRGTTDPMKKLKTNEPFYFDEHNKKVFVKYNGDGLIVASIKLHVLNPAETTNLIRTFDISDAKKGTEFPDFDILIANGKKIKEKQLEPFSEYGLWVSSQNDIVTDVIEEYIEDDKKFTNDKRFLSIKFVLDSAALIADKTYEINFALSIPGLYPITNGRFDGTEAEHEQYGRFSTSVSTYLTHRIITYSIYMEKGIVFSYKPKPCYKVKRTKGKPKYKESNYKNNMFYEKYSFTLENPQDYDRIFMEWDIKNPPKAPPEYAQTNN